MDTRKYIPVMRISAVLVMAVAILVMVGWFFRINVLTSVFPGFASMKFNTALCFIFLGIALYLRADAINSSLYKGLFGASILIAFLVATGTLIEYVGGIDLKIDELFMTDHTSSVEAGRMAPLSAVTFILVSLGISISGRQNKWMNNGSQLLLHISSTIGLLSILGYVYAIPDLYKWEFVTSMAIHTSVLIIILSVAASFLQPSAGITGLLTGDYIGNYISRRLIPTLVLVAATLGYIRILSHRSQTVSVEYGITMLVVSFLGVIVLVIWFVASHLNKIDKRRKGIELALHETNIGLDRLVAEKTASLAEATERLKIATVGAHIGIWDWNIADNKLTWDPIMHMLYASQPEDFAGTFEAWIDMLHRDDNETVRQQIEEAVFSGKQFDMEFRINIPDEAVRFVKGIATVQRDDTGKVVGMIGTTWDISGQKLAELALRKSREQYFQMVDQVEDYSIILLDINGTVLTWNRGAQKIKGYTSEEIIGKNFRVFYEENDQAEKRPESLITTAIRDKKSADEGWRVNKDGRKFWASVVMTTLYDLNDDVVGFSKVTRDLTEKRNAELKIDEINKRNRIFIKQAPFAIAMFDTDMKYLAASHQWLVDYNLTDREVIGISHYEIFPEIGDDWKLIHQQCLRGSVNKNDSAYFKRVDGVEQWISWDVRPWYISDGNVGGILMQTANITDKKLAEQEILRINQHLTAILNSGYVSIITTDIYGSITHFSRGAEEFLQYPASAMVGMESPAIIHLESEVVQRGDELTAQYGREIRGFNVFIELPRQGIPESREWTYVRKDGSTFPVQLVVTAIKNEANEITGFIGVATDLSQRKESEKVMQRAATLESKSKEMEQFAYITSHDLREPLLTIKNYIAILIEDYGADLPEEALRFTQSISNASARMEALINGLLDYSRLSKPKNFERVYCHDIIGTVQMDLDSLIRSQNARVVVDESLPVVNAYPLEFKLLFQNLINNGIKFRKKDISPVIRISSRKIEGGWEFAVNDNGMGIEENAHEKIFIIFQRLHSRSDYPGTGIGLAHCKKIVEIHNGKIWVKSKPGDGSTFYFTILTENSTL